jgi:putative ABC transport system permease protein
MLTDLRFALRLLIQNPGFALAAIATLAVGIGANTAMFSVVYAVLLRPLPYEQPGRLVRLWESWQGHRNLIAPANYLDWRERSRSFARTAAFVPGAANLAGTGEAERIPVAHVDADFFTVLAVQPIMGRTFTLTDESPTGYVALIRESFWRVRLGSDPNVLGRTLTLDGVPYGIVGVLPDSVDQPSRDTVVWRPLYIAPVHRTTRGAHYLSVIGRLQDGVSVRQADEELRAIGADLARAHPTTNARVGAAVVSLHDDGSRNSRTAVLVLFGATAALLLLACVNVAHLLLARGTAREAELAVRAAIGATRARLLRQLLSESVVLAGIGAAAGLLIALWTTLGLRSLVPDTFAEARRAEVNLQVFAFAVAATFATVALFGLLPAIRLSRVSLGSTTRAQATHVTRRATSGRPLIVMQVALAVILVIGAGLLVGTMVNLRQMAPSFATRDLVVGRVPLPAAKYPTGAAQRTFFRDLLDRLEGIGGVEAAAVATRLPLRAQSGRMTFTVDTMPRSSLDGVVVQEMSPRLLEILGIQVLGGRSFKEADSASQHAVLVSRRFALNTWNSLDVVGRRLRMGPTYIEEGFTWFTVVGVVDDVRQFSVATRPAPQVYLPYGQPTTTWAASELVVRTSLPAPQAFAAIRAAVKEVDPAQPVAALSTMEGVLEGTLAQPRFTALLVSTFAGLALLLAVIGIYGVISYAVARRSREIGVRMALGATTTDVLRLVGLEGIWLIVLGLLVGVAGAAVAARGLSGILFGVQTVDPKTYALAASLMLVTAILACLVPTLRATRVDPATVLKAQ